LRFDLFTLTFITGLCYNLRAMEPTKQPAERDRRQYATNLLLVVAAGQAGCLTVAIIFIALLAGLWLDSTFGSRPLFTIILMIGSVPVTLVAMLWVVRMTTSRMKLVDRTQTEELQEAEQRGE
jgi:F0F1-type ATP synthase assembly protein I